MISRPTVFILGAGASAEYGFPVGYALYDKICRGETAAPPMISRQEKILGYRQKRDHDFQQFRTQLEQSGQQSVDAFLETHPDLVEYGKRVIASALIPYEQEDTLFRRPNSSAVGPRWYQLLLAELGDSFDTFAQNQLSVLTFNYDRSLEHFLVVALSRKYKLPLSTAWQQVQIRPIRHLTARLVHIRRTVSLVARTKTTSRFRASRSAASPFASFEKAPSTTEPSLKHTRSCRRPSLS